MKLGAKELRVSEPTEEQLASIKRREIYIICDNVLDTYNIGSIFRLADAVAVKCVYLCGQTEIPPNSRIAKASVGTDKWVEWEYLPTAVDAIKRLMRKFSATSSVIPAPSKGGSASGGKAGIYTKRGLDPRIREDDKKRGIKIIAIEQSPKSIDFRKAKYDEPVVFVVGNETEGISKEALKLADQIVEIPMFGVNKSLNVMVSLAIVMYQAIGKNN